MALARRFPVEIVSVDSAQVYRGMDIGTAKPDAAARALVPHHLIDIIEPVDLYSAARFRADAIEAIAGIRSRSAVPLLVGGRCSTSRRCSKTLRAAFRDPRCGRARRSPVTEAGPRCMPSGGVDPASAARLDTTDAQRIQRALEVSKSRAAAVGAPGRQGRAGALARRSRSRWRRRSCKLHLQIASRFAAMLAAGLVAELSELRSRYALTPNLPSMRCVATGRRGPFSRAYRSKVCVRAELPRHAVGQTPAHLAPRNAGDDLRTGDAAPRRSGFGVPRRRRPVSRAIIIPSQRVAGVAGDGTGQATTHALRQTLGTAPSSAPKPTARRCSMSTATWSTR